MEQGISYRNALGSAMFRVVGLCPLLLLLLWNPLVAPPRFWNASVIARSSAIDASLLIVGVRLVCVRRWAALLSAALAVGVAVLSFRVGDAAIGLWGLVFMIPLLLTFAWRRTMVWRDRKRDLPFALAGVVLIAFVHYAAYLVQRR